MYHLYLKVLLLLLETKCSLCDVLLLCFSAGGLGTGLLLCASLPGRRIFRNGWDLLAAELHRQLFQVLNCATCQMQRAKLCLRHYSIHNPWQMMGINDRYCAPLWNILHICLLGPRGQKWFSSVLLLVTETSFWSKQAERGNNTLAIVPSLGS